MQKIFHHKGFRKYFSNTSWLLIEKVIRLSIGLFVSIWVTRYLGPTQFGVYSYAISFVGLFSVIATLGLDSIVVKELVKNQKKTGEILGTAFILKLFGAILVFFIITLALYLTSSDLQTKYIVYIISASVVFQSFNVIDFYFQSIVKSKFIAFANMAALISTSFVKIFLILSEANLEAFAWVVFVESMVVAFGFIYFFLSQAQVKIKTLSFKTNISLDLLKQSWPLILSGLVISIYMKIDQVMIKELMNAQSVGQYAAAVRLSEAWYFIPIVIASSLFPAVIRAKKTDEILYKRRLQNLYDLMVGLGILIALPMTFYSEWIVLALYGKEFLESSYVLMIHIWAGIFVFAGVASKNWLIVENLQIYFTINTFLGAILNIVLNYFMIIKYGILGSAWATLISQFFASYLSLFFWKNTRANFYNLSKSFFWFRILHPRHWRNINDI